MRRLRHLAAISLLAIPLLALAPGTAHAGVLDVTCPAGSETVSYNPGVTLAERPIAITGSQTFGPCVSRDSSVTTGGRSYSFTADKSCLTLTQGSSSPFTVTWSNGQSSTLQVNFVNNTAGGQVVSTGTGSVTAGEFAGDSVLMVITGPTLDLLQCIGDGITSRTGLLQLELTSLP